MSGRKVVFTSAGSLGEIIPIVGLAAGMQARGYEAKVAVSEVYRDIVVGAGLPFAPLRPNLVLDPDFLTKIWTKPLVWAREVRNPSLRDTYDDLKRAAEGAEMLVSRPLVPVAPLVAEKLKLKWVQARVSPAELFSGYDPPYVPGFSFLRPLKVWPRGLGAVMRFIGRTMKRFLCPQIVELRESLGLPRASSQDYSAIPPALNLALFSSIIGRRQVDWPANSAITGFVFLDEAAPAAPLPKITEAFLASGTPPIVFAFGSMQWSHINRDVVRLGYECAKKLGARAILLCGFDINRSSLPQALPDSIHVVERVPYTALFPHASVVVHHGGIGTTAAALRAGVPQLILPQYFDQPDNAMRIQRLGLGRAEFRHPFDAPRIVSHLRTILSDEAMKDRAAEAGRQIRAECGVKSACDEMEALLANPTARRAPAMGANRTPRWG